MNFSKEKNEKNGLEKVTDIEAEVERRVLLYQY